MRFREHKEKLLKDPGFRKAYEELAPIYEIIRQLVAYRIQKGITQEKLANMIGTKQSSISRFETSMKIPSLSFLQTIASTLELELKLTLKPKRRSPVSKPINIEQFDRIGAGV